MAVAAAIDAELLEAARAVRERAHAPFSQFKVGAALAGFDAAGHPAVFTGCNVENASYGLTVCAERVAIWKALSEGGTRFQRIAVVADTAELTPPCGACRQIIWEFCGDIPILLGNMQGKNASHSSRDLLPHAFDAGFLNR